MVRKEDVMLIRDRALRMLDAAKSELSKRSCDLAAFLSEQAVQLFIKSVILELTGEMPRTHVIRQLLGILRELIPTRAKEIDKFTRENRDLLIRLEEAYISSRYLFRRYTEEEAHELVKFAERAIEFIKTLLSESQDS